MDTPVTQKRHAQWRGPTHSDDYNLRIEEYYQDLVSLVNRARLSEVEIEEMFRRIAQEHMALSTVIQNLRERIEALEAVTTTLSFYSVLQVDTARFDSSTFAVASGARLTHDPVYGLLTLPRVDSSSLSKLFFVNSEGEGVAPPSLEIRVVGTPGTADTPTAIIDQSPPEQAVYRQAGIIWERNVITTASDIDGAEVTVYVKVPTDLFTTDKSNAIAINPYPSFGTTIREISYTSNVSPAMEDSDGYTPINNEAHYSGNEAAVGWVAPGGWTGGFAGDDAVTAMGPRLFYFPAKTITGLRIRLHQATPFRESGNYVYSYGLSHLDLRYDKFLATGKAIIRFDAPPEQTISAVTAVQPEIYSVSTANVDTVMDYRVLWETSFNSGEYTVDPVPNSQRVWVEVTLNNENDQVPALSGLTIEYS